MTLNETEYKALSDIFDGNMEFLSCVSSNDQRGMMLFLAKNLNGTKEGVDRLESKTKKLVESLKNVDYTWPVRQFIVGSLSLFYATMASKIIRFRNDSGEKLN